MQNEGWKCLECGVVYAPFVRECRCSVNMVGNDQVCFHEYADKGTTCTKCGLTMIGLSFDVEPYNATPCQHVYPESGIGTAGTLCTKCGMQKVIWEDPGNTFGGDRGNG